MQNGTMKSIVAGVIRGVLRSMILVVVMAIVAIFMAFIFSLAIGLALISVFWALARGRKPAVGTVFQFAGRVAGRVNRRPWEKSAPFKNDPSADIVDVQGHEVHTELLDSGKPR